MISEGSCVTKDSAFPSQE